MLAGFPLTEEQQLVADTALAFARDRVAPGAAARDHDGRYPDELLPVMAKLGLFGVKVGADDGGAGADAVSYALAIEAVSRSCAATGVTMAVCNLVADVLAGYGNGEQRARLLAPYLAGQRGAGSFCLSEPHCGSDAAALSTTAVRDGDYFVLNGTKQWVTNGAYAGLHIVFAKTSPEQKSHGISCFVVERGTPGLIVGKTEHKMGLRGSNTTQIVLEDCRVPTANLLGDVDRGYAIALANLDGGRIGIAAQACGIAAAALTEGVRYTRDRKAFGRSLAELQAIQFAVADSAIDVDTARLLTLRAAAAKDAGSPRTARESSMAKLFASEAACRVADRMLQVHGGYGYVEEYAIERLYRDARITRIYEGTSEVQRIVIARETLAG
ncbi:MAG: acyl-CoA dehydrogenase [Deltaproteobacteria bacterium]|nr:acyl-CoA dehydrogenase [Deltaproteobacteria bacterium]